MDDIRALDRRVEPEEGTLLADLLWSDPSDDPSVGLGWWWGCGWGVGGVCLFPIVCVLIALVLCLSDPSVRYVRARV